MKRLKRLAIGILVSIMMTLQLCNITMAATGTYSSTQLPSRAAQNLDIPSNVSNGKYYTEIPVTYKGQKVEELTVHMHKEYKNGGKDYVLDGDVSFKVKAYAYKSGNDVKIGLAYGCYGYKNFPGDPGSETGTVEWIQNFDDQGADNQNISFDREDEKLKWQNDQITQEEYEKIISAQKYEFNINKIDFTNPNTQERQFYVDYTATKDKKDITHDRSIDGKKARNGYIAFVSFSGSRMSLSISVTANSKGVQKDSYKANYTDTNNIERIFSKKLKVDPGSYIDVEVEGANLSVQQYKIVNEEKPVLPTDDNGWTDLGKLNESQVNIEGNYSDIMLDKQGYISTKHYDYSGDHSTREVTFGNPTGENLVLQKATGVNNTKYSGESDAYAFFKNSLIEVNGKKDGANKAVKFWGYLKPQGIEKGEFNLGSNSDDGAYGYIMIGDEKVEFVNDWVIAAAYNRSNNNNITLEPGKVYPIYMEWYEGQPTHKAFIPSFKKAGTSQWKAIPQDWFYPSSNTEPGDINTAYFNPVTASRIPLGSTPGTYYAVVQVKDNNNQAYQLSYGPFLIEDNEPNKVGDEERNYIVPCSISNVYWDTTFSDDYRGLTYEIDLSDVINKSVVGLNYDKMVVKATPDTKDYTVSVANNKITIKFEKKTAQKETEEIKKTEETEEAEKTGVLLSSITGRKAGPYNIEIGIYIPTTLNDDVKYYGKDGYIEKCLPEKIAAKLTIKGEKKYIEQTVLPNGNIEEEVKFEPVQIIPGKDGALETDIKLAFSEIPNIH